MNETTTRRFGLVDLGLILSALIWAVNFSVVKATIAYIPPLAFNALRLVGTSLVLLALVPFAPKRAFTRPELARVLFLGIIGHTGYQLLFILGIHITTASNSAVLLGLTPVAVAAIGAAWRVERVAASAWAGILVSVVGVYFVMGSSRTSEGRLSGDILVIAATFCWSAYTVAGKPLVDKHGPVRITAYSMVMGTILFLPFAAPSLSGLSIRTVPWTAWAGTGYSIAFALSLAYLFWYYGVARVGPTRTSIYSNLIPVVALLVSWLALGETIHRLQLVGAGVILLGIHIVRRSRVSGP